MSLSRPCCSPCNRRRYCRISASCCLECHMAWEITHAAPYLPPADRERLEREHAELAAAGYPAHAIRAHSQWEESVFRKYCPPDVLEVVFDDHMTWERGQLHRR